MKGFSHGIFARNMIGSFVKRRSLKYVSVRRNIEVVSKMAPAFAITRDLVPNVPVGIVIGGGMVQHKCTEFTPGSRGVDAVNTRGITAVDD
jgi:hypothetical protein